MAAEHADPAHETDYEIGTMDIEQHRATYAWFGGLVKWGSLILAVTVLFLTMATSTGAGLFGAAAAAFVLAVAGFFLLKSKPSTDGH